MSRIDAAAFDVVVLRRETHVNPTQETDEMTPVLDFSEAKLDYQTQLCRTCHSYVSNAARLQVDLCKMSRLGHPWRGRRRRRLGQAEALQILPRK